MRKLTLVVSCFIAALVFGISFSVVFTEDAEAMYCDVYQTHYIFGDDCYCNGQWRFWVTKCLGYIYFNGEEYDCGCWTWCSACPPPKEGPIPYDPPGE